MIIIIDYGMGNTGSILNMLDYLKIKAKVSNKPETIKKADKIILPGVGSFDEGMKNLKKLGLIEILNKKVLKEKTPVLGVCLGMQLLTKSSEEGDLPGLGWIDAKTVRFIPKDRKIKIPHMGWNIIDVKRNSELFKNLPEKARFYFVHSYHVDCKDKKDILSTTSHGREFASAVQRNNIFGVQFHPEKSHKFGMQIYKNFAGLKC